MARLASVSKRLSSAVIAAARRAIERAAREAVPTLGDFCLVHLVAGRAIRCVAGAHSTREGGRDVRALMKMHRIREHDRDSTVAQVVRTQRAMLRREIYPERSARVRTGVGELHRRLAITSALVVPIRHHDVVLGAISLCYSHSRRAYAARHVAAAERLANRIAHTLVPIDTPVAIPTAGRRVAAAGPTRRRVMLRH